MTLQEFSALPEKQANAIVNVYVRHFAMSTDKTVYIPFSIMLEKHTAQNHLSNYVGVQTPYMYIGIEPDGYTHT